ncbi:hypothetical protein NC652_031566 [Populus alba x Populus x berolinensis]|nr:hypothetical protein NC652_031566 [Populus alba x Populus x berolinensis]
MSMCLCHPAKEFSMVLDVIITINQSVMMFCNRLNKTTLINAVKRTCGLPCALTLSNHSPLHFSTDTLSKVEQMVGNSDMHITRVLFCGPYFPASHQYTKEYLQKYPFIQVDDVPLAGVPDVISNYNICIVKNMRLTSNIISRATQMKLIMQFGVGLEGVDIDAATKYGIKVARIPGDVTGNAASCAEMTIYLMLGLLRKQNEMQISIKQKRLGVPVGETLLGKTVFIMGFGNIGIDLAKRLRPFGVKIIATKRSWALHSEGSLQSDGFLIENGTNDNLVDEKGSHEDIYKFAGESDIVVCCLSMNKETVSLCSLLYFVYFGKISYWIALKWICSVDLELAHLDKLPASTTNS